MVLLSHRNKNLRKRKKVLEAEQRSGITPGQCCHLIWTGHFLDILSVQIRSHNLIVSLSGYMTPNQVSQGLKPPHLC